MLARFRHPSIVRVSRVFEAHSTDYQTPSALRNLVRDGFAILKVGPALTFAFREAVFGLAAIERTLVEKAVRSNIVETLERTMVARPEIRKKLEDLGLEIVPPEQRTPEYFAQFLKGDVERWGKVIKAAGISMD